ncbi:MAG: helix-turn-helix domain-containing protein [Bacteroidetes bacterium]|nr:helix-turn-helix domain-containing protein [Bacteroidota bacterium]
MNWTILKNEKDYTKASERLMEIFEAKPNTREADELALLILLIEDYDNKHYQLPQVDVLEAIKEKMEEQGLKNKDLELVIGSKGHVSAILSGKRELTLKIATRLKNYFNLPAELFLQAR